MNTPDRNPDDQPQGDELLSAYLDNELSEGDRAEVQAQLEQDPALRESLAELETLSKLLQKLPRHALPDQFSDRVLRRAERQMLLGDHAPAPSTRNEDATPGSSAAASSKGAGASRYWWIPATLAALLAGILFLPALMRPADVAKVDQEQIGNDLALRQETRESAPAVEAARSIEPKASEASQSYGRQEAMAQVEDGPARGAARTADSPAADPALRDAVTDGDMSTATDEFEIAPAAAADAPALAFKEGGEKDAMQRQPAATKLAERERVQLGAKLPAAPGQIPATDWQFEQDSRLIEVTLPSASDQRGPSLAIEPKVAARADRVTEGAVFRGEGQLADAGQLYGIQGPPEELGKMIRQWKHQGAIVHDHELPVELQKQLQAPDRRTWYYAPTESPSTARIAGLRGATESNEPAFTAAGGPATQPLPGPLRALAYENPEIQIVLLEPDDSAALTRIAEQYAGRAVRKQRPPAWLKNALGAEPAASPPAEAAAGQARETGLPADVSRRLNEQFDRVPGAAAEDRSSDEKAPPPERAQLYLWLRPQPPPAAAPE